GCDGSCDDCAPAAEPQASQYVCPGTIVTAEARSAPCQPFADWQVKTPVNSAASGSSESVEWLHTPSVIASVDSPVKTSTRLIVSASVGENRMPNRAAPVDAPSSNTSPSFSA